MGERVRGPGCLTAYGDIFVLDYAARLVNDPRLGGLYDRVPSRLRTFDAAEQAELLPTLEAFLAEGSVHGAAVQLSVHGNSVMYRLKKIEEITRIDLDDPETQAAPITSEVPAATATATSASVARRRTLTPLRLAHRPAALRAIGRSSASRQRHQHLVRQSFGGLERLPLRVRTLAHIAA